MLCGRGATTLVGAEPSRLVGLGPRCPVGGVNLGDFARGRAGQHARARWTPHQQVSPFVPIELNGFTPVPDSAEVTTSLTRALAQIERQTRGTGSLAGRARRHQPELLPDWSR